MYNVLAASDHMGGLGGVCRWAVGVGGWDNNTAFDTLMDLFFADPEAPGGGLGLTQVRYNIGGSDNAAGDAHFLRAGGFVQTYEPSKGQWDWTADGESSTLCLCVSWLVVLHEELFFAATQRRVLTAAQYRGVRFVQGFSNSPPYWMTVSGSVTGNKDGTKDNLKAGSFDDFAQHLATVTAHFHHDFNITFDSVTPLNEPVTGWWKYGNQQEGCHFDKSSQSRIVGLTGKALRSKGLPADLGVSGPEENRIQDSVSSVEAYRSTDLASLQLITTHTYNGASGSREALSRLASKEGKRLWASEYGDGDVSGLTLAARITTDLNKLNCSVWTLWQVVGLELSVLTNIRVLNRSKMRAHSMGPCKYSLRILTTASRPGVAGE